MKNKKLLSLAIALVLCFSSFLGGCSYYFDARYPFFAPDFSERKYVKPDETALYASIAKIKELCKQSGNSDEIFSERTKLLYALYEASTSYTVKSIQCDLDVTNQAYAEEYNYIFSFLNKFTNEVKEVEKAILLSSYKDELIALTGEEYANEILSSATKSEVLLALEEKETKLILEYSSLYSSAAPAKMAEIYRELVITRNDIAALYVDEEGKPYDNYLDYSYAQVFGRDYSPDEARSMRDAVAENLCELYLKLVAESHKYASAYTTAVSESDLKSFAATIIRNTLKSASSSWNYMISKGLYDFTVSDTKSGSSYVTEFIAYGDGFMLIDAYGRLVIDLPSVIHEFGHYNALFNVDAQKEGNGTMNYDLAETHSQCFELLALDATEELFLSKGYDFKSYSFIKMQNFVWALLSNSAFDEFEYAVYNADEASLSQDFFEKTFENAIEKYVPDCTYEYYDIPHIMRTPGYCVSYVVSLLLSTEIAAMDNSLELYEGVLSYGSNHYLSDVCEPLGLANPLSEQTVRFVADYYKTFATKKLAVI